MSAFGGKADIWPERFRKKVAAASARLAKIMLLGAGGATLANAGLDDNKLGQLALIC
jgi:hypothetical protein